jgi:hypothetical protein
MLWDDDQKRIRKTTPEKETLYFGELYERVTAKKGAAKTEHRYCVSLPLLKGRLSVRASAP